MRAKNNAIKKRLRTGTLLIKVIIRNTIVKATGNLLFAIFSACKMIFTLK